MEENIITAITKEKTDVLKDAYKHTLELLDAYDHQTLACPEGTYYDGNETIEEEECIEVITTAKRNHKEDSGRTGKYYTEGGK